MNRPVIGRMCRIADILTRPPRRHSQGNDDIDRLALLLLHNPVSPLRRLRRTPGKLISNGSIPVEQEVTTLHQHLQIIADGDHKLTTLIYLLKLMGKPTLSKTLCFSRPLVRIKPDTSNTLLLQELPNIGSDSRNVNRRLPTLMAE